MLAKNQRRRKKSTDNDKSVEKAAISLRKPYFRFISSANQNISFQSQSHRCSCLMHNCMTPISYTDGTKLVFVKIKTYS